MEAMTEDELLAGVTDALTIGGWRWFHVRRSDKALTMGATGWPDIFAIHPHRGAMALELKRAGGRLDPEQAVWIAWLNMAGIPARVVEPRDYDLILSVILGRVP